MENLNVKDRMLAVLKSKDGFNTFTVKQARHRFGIINVAARINELRQEGYCIYTNKKTLKDGRKIKFYRLGTPTKALVKAALKSGYSLA